LAMYVCVGVPRVAFQCLGRLCIDFRETVDEKVWKAAKGDNSVGYKENLRTFLSEYRDPKSFDSVVRTSAKVDDARAIMEKNIESLLQNHEDIDVLLKKSEDVSESSKTLFEGSKKVRKSCCKLQ